MTKDVFSKVFGGQKPIIGMIHLQALPGTPAFEGSLQAVIDCASEEADLLNRLGVHALLIENMHDTPYLRKVVGPEITAAATAAAIAVKSAAPNLPSGLQLLAGANKEALAVAQAAKLNFIRAEGFVFGHLADEGWMDSDAGKLLRYRKQIDAQEIAVFTDIKKKHSAHAMSADVSLAETAKAAAFFRSDGVIITGGSTGQAAAKEEVAAVRKAASDMPILIGSGINPQNLEEFYDLADGFIVGSFIKGKGHWANAISEERVKNLLDAYDRLARA